MAVPEPLLAFFTTKDGNGDVQASLLAAIVGQIGAEFNVPGVPLSFSLDWRPAINFGSGFNFGWTGFALGIRYRF